MNTFALPTTKHHGTVDVTFPLHPATDSEEHVSELVGSILGDIDHKRGASHADVLQALAIATAIRLSMAETAARSGVDFSMELLDIAVDTIDERVTPAA